MTDKDHMLRKWINFLIYLIIFWGQCSDAFEYCENIFLTESELQIKIYNELYQQEILAKKLFINFEYIDYPILYNDGIPMLTQKVLEPMSRSDLMYMEPMRFNRLMERMFESNELPSNFEISPSLPYYQFEGIERTFVQDVLQLVSRKGYSNSRELQIKKITDKNINEVIAFLVQKKVTDEKSINLFFVLITIEDGHRIPKIKYAFDEFTFL